MAELSKPSRRNYQPGYILQLKFFSFGGAANLKIIDLDAYVEIKGYKTEKDKCKWNQFPGKLIILMGKDLDELGVL